MEIKKVILLLLVFSPLLFFSCRGEKQPPLSSALKQYVAQVKNKMLCPVDIASEDSGYWIGTCWNLYQLTNDSCFRIEAERCMEKIKPVWADSTLTSDKALRLFLAFGKGFDATGERRYKHEVWNLGDRLLEDSLCIDHKTVEALLWGTAHKGCHCLKEAAIRWGARQKLPLTTVDDIQAFASLYMYTDSLIYLNAVADSNEKSLVHSTSDSIHLASVYICVANRTNNKELKSKAADLLTRLHSLSVLSFEDEYYYVNTLLNSN